MEEVGVLLAEQGHRARRLRVSHAFHSAHMDGVLDELTAVAARFDHALPAVPVISNVTGLTVDTYSPEYWATQVRGAVRFADGIRLLAERGVRRAIELGPDAVLTVFATAGDDPVLTAAPTMRRTGDETETFLAGLGTLHACGAPVDWTAFLPPAPRTAVTLPTYAFQREPFWLDAAPPAGQLTAGELTASGLAPTGHALLTGSLELTDGEEVVLLGALAATRQRWLPDHAVNGTVLLPGAAFLDLALRAGQEVGHEHVGSLVLQAPLTLSPRDTVAVQVHVGPPDDDSRPFTVSSRPADDQPWTLHASGSLAVREEQGDTASPDPRAWPPPGATPINVDDLYTRFAGNGFAYGPAFQGVRAAWSRDDEVFAEVALPDPHVAEAAGYCLHPALLDAALHPIALSGMFDTDEPGRAHLPFSWGEVTLHAEQAVAARVRIAPTGPQTVSIALADPAGNPLLDVGELVLRPVRGPLAEPAHLSDLHALVWEPAPAGTRPARRVGFLGSENLGVIEALESDGVHVETYADVTSLAAMVASGSTAPATVVWACPPAGTVHPDDADPAARAHDLTHAALPLLQDWIAEDGLRASTLVVLTQGAVAASEDDDVTDPGAGAVWGLARSAQSEAPGQVALLDIDALAGTGRALAALFAALPGPQTLVRDGQALLPRLTSPDTTGPDTTGSGGAELPGWGDGAVLLTGATGGIGRELARHLVTELGVRDLVMVSRRGPAADGVDALVRELVASGAEVSVHAVDAADRKAVGDLVAEVVRERPLTAVVHTAGVLDDGTLPSLTAERLDTVLRPKADAAVALHEATRDKDLRAFVLFSSAAGVLGGAGQGNYAAANTFLDSYALHLRRRGVPAVSLAWGLWESPDGMASGIGSGSGTGGRGNRSGIAALPVPDGLRLFDLAVGLGRATLVPMRLDIEMLGAGEGSVPVLLQALAPARKAPRGRRAASGARTGTAARTAAAPGAGLRQHLVTAPEDDRRRMVLDEARRHVAAVLGFADPSAVADDHAFVDAGFDSLSAVELRNRLAAATGLRLPATLAFEHENVTALADFLLARLADDLSAASAPAAPGGPGDGVTGTVTGTVTGSGGGSGGGAASGGFEGSQTLMELYTEAFASGKWGEIFELLRAASAFRPQFTGADDLDAAGQLPRPVPLSRGDGSAMVYCFSSCLAVAGIHQYARFANSFRGSRDVRALAVPGFGRGEALPRDVDAVIEAQAEAVRRDSDGRPVVLLGSSAGGWFAHAAAGYLEKLGVEPAGVVLVDTYTPKSNLINQFGLSLMDGMVEREGTFVTMDDARLTAMGWYLTIFGQWEPREISAPTLLVRATEPLTAAPMAVNGDDWRSFWDYPHEVVDVRGNHFTMLEDHSHPTALVIEDWILRRDTK